MIYVLPYYIYLCDAGGRPPDSPPTAAFITSNHGVYTDGIVMSPTGGKKYTHLSLLHCLSLPDWAKEQIRCLCSQICFLCFFWNCKWPTNVHAVPFYLFFHNNLHMHNLFLLCYCSAIDLYTGQWSHTVFKLVPLFSLTGPCIATLSIACSAIWCLQHNSDYVAWRTADECWSLGVLFSAPHLQDIWQVCGKEQVTGRKAPGVLGCTPQ